jgi:hypothetical protein
MTRAEKLLADKVAAEVIRLLKQPNSIGLPEQTRLEMAVVMACEKYRADPEQFFKEVA